jgi:hypothetical protein
MVRTFLSVVAAALLISVILLTPASSADTGEATIPYGGHRSWSVAMDRPFILTYSIETLDGSPVNVLVIPSDNYSNYLAGSLFNAVVEAGVSNVTNTTVDVTMPAGNYYVVIEAPADPGIKMNDTLVNYRIDASSNDAGGSSLQIILGVGAVALFGTILFFLIETKLRGKR